MASTAPTPKPEEHGTLAGVLVPGGAAVALILGCNILHTLGPWALLGLVALALAGTAATLGTITRAARGPRTRTVRTRRTAAKSAAARTAKSPKAAPAPASRGASVASPKRVAAKAPAASAPAPAKASPKAPAMAGAPAKPPARGVDPRTGVFGRPGGSGGPAARTPKAETAKPTARTVKAPGAPKARIPAPRPGKPSALKPLSPAKRTKAAKAGGPAAKAKKRAKVLRKPPSGGTTRTALRRAARGTANAARWASPRIARTAAATAGRIARMHRRARKVRLHHPGPNWWKPLNRAWAKTLVPALKATRALLGNRHIRDWVDLHRRLHPVHVAGIKAGPAPVHVRRVTHRPVTSPIRKETPVSHPAIASATESVQAAFAAVNGSPADSMREYNEILAGVPELLDALAAGLRGFADTSADEFAVDSTIPDMLRDGSGYALNLGAHLTEVHNQFREVHDKQISNYEEPTVGAEKWDVRANS